MTRFTISTRLIQSDNMWKVFAEAGERSRLFYMQEVELLWLDCIHISVNTFMLSVYDMTQIFCFDLDI